MLVDLDRWSGYIPRCTRGFHRHLAVDVDWLAIQLRSDLSGVAILELDSSKWEPPDLASFIQDCDHVGIDLRDAAANLPRDLLLPDPQVLRLEDDRSPWVVDADGFQAITRDKLEKQLNKIGKQKLNVLFSPEEMKFFDDVLKVTKLREPVRGTGGGLGPSAQAAIRLEKKLSDLPVLGGLVDFIDVDVQGRIVLKAKPTTTPRVPSALEREIPGLAAPVGIAAAVTATEE